jgi:hypothetical protein
MHATRVYLDTTVLKFSATELPRLQPRNSSINWGGKNFDVTVHDFIEVNPNDSISNDELRAEAELLPRLAALGKRGVIEYVIGNETLWESCGLPNMDSKSGQFYGAPIKTAQSPFEYGRVVVGGEIPAREQQYDFLCSIKQKRFLELQKMTGAYQGKQPLNHNQLLDAFHLWCAEDNNCEFFLTLDFKAIKVLQLSPRKSPVQAVRPTELISLLGQRAIHGSET